MLVELCVWSGGVWVWLRVEMKRAKGDTQQQQTAEPSRTNFTKGLAMLQTEH